MPTSTATIGPARIAVWLARGARDLGRAPLASLAHGLVFTIVALAILGIGWNHGWLLAGAFTGFVLPAPALATGLYELSRRLERGDSATVTDAIGAWRAASPALLRFGALLAAIGTAWVGFCWLVVRASVGSGAAAAAAAPEGGVAALLRLFADERGAALFVAWIVAGGPPALRDAALARLEFAADAFLSVSPLLAATLPALLAERAAIGAALRGRVAANRARLAAALQGAGATLLPAEAGWAAIVRVPGAHDEEALAIGLLDRRGVLVQPGFVFDLEPEDAGGAPCAHLVLALLHPPERFERGIEALAAFLAEACSAGPG